MKCPKPTQDVVLNLKNRQKAIDKVGYGPLNPSEDNDKFWQAKADIWDVSISDAKKQLCSNCAAFNRSEEMLACIDKGMGGEEKDSWDVIDAGQLGYCEMLDFKCAASRTCDAWVDGNAKRNSQEKVTMLDAYFQKVDAFLAVIEAKDATAAGTYEIDVETKVRKVKDSAYWGRPVGTPIVPGMKPEGPKSPLGRARAAAGKPGGGDSGGAKPKPKKRIRPGGKKPSKPAGSDRSEVAGADRSDIAGADSPDVAGGKKPAPKKRIRPKKPASQEREDRGPKGMTDNEREEFTDLDKPGKDKYTGARNHGYDHESAMDYAEGVEGNQVERDAQNDPDSDFGRAVESGKLREWTERDGGKGSKFEKGINEKTGAEYYKPAKAEDFSVDAVAKELGTINPEGRTDGSGSVEDPIDVGDDVELAHKLLSEGKHIRMSDTKSVSTLIDKLREVADDARSKGKDAPEYDLCKVSVPKTNLFCVESKGIPRTQMPQFKGAPHEGSFAETKVGEKGEADVEAEFRELLDTLGISTEMKTVKAADLKASQENLDGAKVAGMAQAMRDGKIPDAPIYVTRDGYIVDGHHRWAAKVAIDIEDGVTGDIEMPVEVIDGDIGYILDVANGFADIAGIKRKGLGAAAEGVKKLPLNPDGTLCLPCMANWK